MKPYNVPERVSSDQGGSVDHRILYMQRLLCASSISTAFTWIPCDLIPISVQITPVKYDTISANGVAFFTTTGGWQADDLDYNDLSEHTAVDDWVQNTAYYIGSVVLDPDDLKAYVCVQAHTSTTGGTAAADWATDIALGYWEELPEDTNFVKLTHTSPGSGKIAHFTALIFGYKQND